MWGQGFELFVIGCACSAPLLDCMGPRCFATIGLALEYIGHDLLAGACQGQSLLPVAYGLVGIGGNMLMLASVHFSELFDRSCTAAAVLSGAYQLAGFMFTVLTMPHVTFQLFFRCYQGLCLLGLVAVFCCYPDVPYRPGELPRCERPRLRCRRTRLEGCPTGSKCWLFLLAFSWAATCSSECSETRFNAPYMHQTRSIRGDFSPFSSVFHRFVAWECSESNVFLAFWRTSAADPGSTWCAGSFAQIVTAKAQLEGAPAGAKERLAPWRRLNSAYFILALHIIPLT